MKSKKDLSERDIITKYIIPSIEQSGWDKQTQLREEFSFTDGRIFVKGKKTKRGERKRADIIIYYKDELWECYKRYNGLVTKEAEETSLSSYFFDSNGRSPINVISSNISILISHTKSIWHFTRDLQIMMKKLMLTNSSARISLI